MKKLNSILLVDDDNIANAYNKMVIGSLGITGHINIVGDGREALDYIACRGKYADSDRPWQSPELIFLDINMPGMNGFEFLEAYNDFSQNREKDPVIVMLTTSFMEKDRARADFFDIVKDFTNKPLQEEYLLRLIDRYF